MKKTQPFAIGQHIPYPTISPWDWDPRKIPSRLTGGEWFTIAVAPSMYVTTVAFTTNIGSEVTQFQADQPATRIAIRAPINRRVTRITRIIVRIDPNTLGPNIVDGFGIPANIVVEHPRITGVAIPRRRTTRPRRRRRLRLASG